MVSKAVFLDKAHPLLESSPYHDDPTRLRLASGATNGLQLLQEVGYKLIIASNQPGIARGVFPERALQKAERYLHSRFNTANVSLHAFYYCPHHPEGKILPYAIHCACRKPKPGMLFRAAHEHNINLSASWCIGDTLDDIEAGCRAGCQTILIKNGHETHWNLSTLRRPHHMVTTFFEACELIATSHAFVPDLLLRTIHPHRQTA